MHVWRQHIARMPSYMHDPGRGYLAHIHAVDKDAGHPKSGSLLVDVGLIIAQAGACGSWVVHADSPLVVLHHEDAGQLVEGGHVQALIELAYIQE